MRVGKSAEFFSESGGRDWLSILLVTCSPGLLRDAKIRNAVKPNGVSAITMLQAWFRL